MRLFSCEAMLSYRRVRSNYLVTIVRHDSGASGTVGTVMPSSQHLKRTRVSRVSQKIAGVSDCNKSASRQTQQAA